MANNREFTFNLWTKSNCYQVTGTGSKKIIEIYWKPYVNFFGELDSTITDHVKNKIFNGSIDKVSIINSRNRRLDFVYPKVTIKPPDQTISNHPDSNWIEFPPMVIYQHPDSEHRNWNFNVSDWQLIIFEDKP